MGESSFSVTSLSKIDEDWGEDPRDFWVKFRALICSDDLLGDQSFFVTVVSPLWIARQLEADPAKVWSAYGCILMSDFDQREILRHVEQKVAISNAQSWGEMKEHCRRYFEWVD